MDGLAVVLWGIYFTLALAVPVAIRVRRTRTTALRVGRARPGSVQWIGETIELVALGLSVAAAFTAESLEPVGWLDGGGADAAGAALFLAGLALIVVSQATMGASWRIGLDPRERTGLVTSGIFAVARNPIFSALVLVAIGMALVVPNVLALAAVPLMVVSVEIQARLVEEPYLRSVHGEAYARYAERVGRFVPGVGRGIG